MKTSVVFPMFWGREKDIIWAEGDFYYDHPTPIDSEGTILPLFKSMEKLKDKDFDVIIISGNCAKGYEEKTYQAAADLIAKEKGSFTVYNFSYPQLAKLRDFFKDMGKDHLNETLSITGYSPIRNMCLVVANILDSEIAVSIDDDIIFTDPQYISIVKNTIKTKYDNQEILALCGPYLTEQDTILMPEKEAASAILYGNIGIINQAFQKFIIEGERYKKVPFAIMGNIAVHRDFYMKIPLDPPLQRGEDSDWVMNANIFGFDFVMDNQLLVKHCPAKRPHPAWRPLREDIKRLFYIKEKIARSLDSEKTKKLDVASYDPFPGKLLRDDLLDRITRASLAMSQEFLITGDTKNAAEALRNIKIAHHSMAPRVNPFQAYVDFQSKWEEMMGIVADNRDTLKKILF